jgi:hypothetical protein
MDKLNVEALLRAADLIDYDKPVYLMVWECCDKPPKQNIYQVNARGHVANIIGHAMVDPWFINKGFKQLHSIPTFGDFIGFFAVKNFFGLTYDQTNELFSKVSESKNGHTLANMIRDFVSRNQQ